MPADTKQTAAWVLCGAAAAAALGMGVPAFLAVAQSGTVGFYAALAGFLTFGPLAMWYFGRGGRAFTFMPLLTGYFLLEYAAGGLFYRQPREDSALRGISRVYSADAMNSAMLIAFGCWVTIVVGYVIAIRVFPMRSKPRGGRVDARNATLLVLVLLAVGWTARLLLVQRGWYFHIAEDGDVVEASALRNIVGILSNLPLVAMALVGVRHYAVEPTRVYWLLFATEIAFAVPSGERSRIVALALMMLIVRYFASPKPFPRRAAIVTALLLLFVVFPFGAAYREGSGTATGYQSDPIGQLKAAATSIGDDFPSGLFTAGTEATLQRFVGSTSLAAMAQRGTGPYPVEPSEATNIYLSAFVPKALLPGKVDPSGIANEFGRSYGIIKAGNTSAVAMTIMGDIWGTFGAVGLALGMLGLGFLVRGIEAYLGDLRTDYAALAIYGVVVGGFLLGLEASVPLGPLQSLKEAGVYLVVIWATARFAVVWRKPVRPRPVASTTRERSVEASWTARQA